MPIACVDLRTEGLRDPIGLDARAPRLSWKLAAGAEDRDVIQLAHRVEVEDTWDSGRIDGWHQTVRFPGPLTSGRPVRWRAQAWTSAGETGWSPWATFEPGILEREGWRAAMITAQAATPVVRFATTVAIPPNLVAARLRLTAHGVVTAAIDGVDVGDEVLAPGWTAYRSRLVVRTHDVTSHLRSGTAVELALTVAPGWFSGRFGLWGGARQYGDHVGALAQLELRRADGSVDVVGTDESWTATSTPYLLAELYDGETFDANLPATGAPAPVRLVADFDPGVLCAPPVPPVRRLHRFAPVERRGAIVDFGQNLVGWVRIVLHDVAAGTQVVLRHAEVLGPDGDLFTAPLRTARATDTYVAAGAAEEVYEPRFTFHGFRYAEITGVDQDHVTVEAVAIHTDLEQTGTFSCSEPLLERLHENVVWGLRGNFVSVPTDCPQRDERLGWTGDAQVFAPTASFLYDCEGFWRNWLADLAAEQAEDGGVPNVVPELPTAVGPAAGWGDACTVVPWTTYVASGDPTVLHEFLPAMERWVDFVWSRLDAQHRWVQDFQFGDWLDPDAPSSRPWAAKAAPALVATAYAAHSAHLLAQAAAVVGDEALARRAGERFAVLRDAWWAHDGAAAATTQTGAALALAFDLSPAGVRARLGDALAGLVADAGDHLATGFLGTPLLLPALSATGHLDRAYAVLLQRTSPSWLYQVLAGATTIWERWDALRPDGSVVLDALGRDGGDDTSGAMSMVSFNHYAYGAVADWLHTTVAGLKPDPDDPGYHHVIIEPQPGGGLTRAAASINSRYGRTAVAWELRAGVLHAEVDLPPNTSATVRLPGRPEVKVGSGHHRF